MKGNKTYINRESPTDTHLEENELEILHMIAYEYNITEIQMETGYEPSVIKSIISRIYKKLEVTSRAGLIRAAYEKSILKLW